MEEGFYKCPNCGGNYFLKTKKNKIVAEKTVALKYICGCGFKWYHFKKEKVMTDSSIKETEYIVFSGKISKLFSYLSYGLLYLIFGIFSLLYLILKGKNISDIDTVIMEEGS
jgi:hypothetical protein